MVIAILIAAVLLALCLVPLVLTGDLPAFIKRHGMILAIGLAAMLNAVLLYSIAEKWSVRSDLTADEKYTVNPSLLNIIRKLDDQVQIVYYTSSRIQQFIPYKMAMTDKLNEIKSGSGGWVDFKVEDVDQRDEKLMAELGAHGFLQQKTDYKNDEVVTSLFISGLRITYKDKEPQYIPELHLANLLEYELGEQFIELYIKERPSEKPVIAVYLPPSPMGAGMPGRPQQGNGFEWLVDERAGISSKKFDVKPIDMTQNNSIPEKTALLVMIRPKLLDERQRFEVEKYLASGGKIMLLASPLRYLGRSVEPTPFGLEEYLENIGVTMGHAILADKSHLANQQQTAEYPPFMIKIKAENLDQTTSLTSFMPGLVMPTPTEIILDKEKLLVNPTPAQIVINNEKPGEARLCATVLAKTTDQNWELKVDEYGTLLLDRAAILGPDTTSPPRTVFAMLKGQFPFPFEGKPVPDWPGAVTDKDKEKDKDKPKAPIIASLSSKRPGTLVMCSAPESFFEPYLKNPALAQLIQAGNVNMLLNVIESMSYGDDLIRLRSQHYETRTIKMSGEHNESLRLIWKFALIAGIPAAVLLFAIYRFILRRVTQLGYERKFAGTTGPSSFSE